MHQPMRAKNLLLVLVQLPPKQMTREGLGVVGSNRAYPTNLIWAHRPELFGSALRSMEYG
jgi:hypothetical protein